MSPKNYRIELTDHGSCWGAILHVIEAQPELSYQVSIGASDSWEQAFLKAGAKIDQIRHLEWVEVPHSPGAGE